MVWLCCFFYLEFIFKIEFSIRLPCSGNSSGTAMFSIGLLIQTRHGKPLPGTPLRLNLRKECAQRGTVYDKTSLSSSSQGIVCFILLTLFYFFFDKYYLFASKSRKKIKIKIQLFAFIVLFSKYLTNYSSFSNHFFIIINFF